MAALKDHYMNQYFNDGYQQGFNFEPLIIPENVPSAFRGVWEDGYNSGHTDAEEHVSAYMNFIHEMN